MGNGYGNTGGGANGPIPISRHPEGRHAQRFGGDDVPFEGIAHEGGLRRFHFEPVQRQLE